MFNIENGPHKYLPALCAAVGFTITGCGAYQPSQQQELIVPRVEPLVGELNKATEAVEGMINVPREQLPCVEQRNDCLYQVTRNMHFAPEKLEPLRAALQNALKHVEALEMQR